MKTKNRKPRKITVQGDIYHWLVSSPEEDYGMVHLKIWRGKKVMADWWLRQEYQPIKPAFVAKQIDYMLEPVEFYRAGGECRCETCGLLYFNHPYDGPFTNSMGHESRQWLHRLCNGDLVKL